MTAVSGANIRAGEAYWELSGPSLANRQGSCRACKKIIYKGDAVMVREGRKLRFLYHKECFTGDADPRTQDNSSFCRNVDYHQNTAPKLSSLEGPRAVLDPDGREMTRKVFKPEAPSVLGQGKWSVKSRGYNPSASK
jgi:hypothetical protein